MANLVYGGKRPNVIKYNNADVHHVVYGGKTIWNKRITVTITKKTPYTFPADNMKIISFNGYAINQNDLRGLYVKKGGKIQWRTLPWDDKEKPYADLWNSSTVGSFPISNVDPNWRADANSATVVLEY